MKELMTQWFEIILKKVEKNTEILNGLVGGGREECGQKNGYQSNGISEKKLAASSTALNDIDVSPPFTLPSASPLGPSFVKKRRKQMFQRLSARAQTIPLKNVPEKERNSLDTSGNGDGSGRHNLSAYGIKEIKRESLDVSDRTEKDLELSEFGDLSRCFSADFHQRPSTSGTTDIVMAGEDVVCGVLGSKNPSESLLSAIGVEIGNEEDSHAGDMQHSSSSFYSLKGNYRKLSSVPKTFRMHRQGRGNERWSKVGGNTRVGAVKCLICSAVIKLHQSSITSCKGAHARTHLEAAPYKCLYCNFVGRQKNNVKNHMINLHKDIDNDPMVTVDLEEYNKQVKAKIEECFG